MFYGKMLFTYNGIAGVQSTEQSVAWHVMGNLGKMPVAYLSER